jgi:tetratricopeptide (TPR) repeat protein
MKRARDLAGNKRFRDAESELRGAGVSPLLKAAFERQRDIISALARAEIHQNNEAWDLALQEYRRVVALDANFEPAPDKDMERCYQRLRERVVAEVTDFLNQTPPDTVGARARLTQAETAGWITPLVSRDYDRLRNWLSSQEYVGRLPRTANTEGNLAEAKQALAEAERLAPGDQPDTQFAVGGLSEALEAGGVSQRPSLLAPRFDVSSSAAEIAKLGRRRSCGIRGK